MAIASGLRRTSKNVLGKANAAGVLVILASVGLWVGGSVGVTVVGVVVGVTVSVGIGVVGVGVTVRVAVGEIVAVSVAIGKSEVAVGFSASMAAEGVGCCEERSNDCASVATSINVNPTSSTIPKAMRATLFLRPLCSDTGVAIGTDATAGDPSAVQSA